MSIPGGLFISRCGQASLPGRSRPARRSRRREAEAGPGGGGEAWSAPRCPQIKPPGRGPDPQAAERRRRRVTAQTTWWGGRPGIHSHVSDCGEIRSVDKRCPVPAAPPPPFSSSGLFPPPVAAQPRDHPLQKANNTLAEDDSLSETAPVRRANSPSVERSPAPENRAPSTTPQRDPAGFQWQSRASGLGVGEGQGREVLSRGRRARAGHATPLPGLSWADFPSGIKSRGSGTTQRLGA